MHKHQSDILNTPTQTSSKNDSSYGVAMSSPVSTNMSQPQTHAPSPQSQPVCYLLDKTSAEIRNQIYEFVFTPKQGNKWHNLKNHETPNNNKAFLLTCSKVNKEAGLLYREIHTKFWVTAEIKIKIRAPYVTKKRERKENKTMADINAFASNDLAHVSNIFVCPYDGPNLCYKMISPLGVWQDGWWHEKEFIPWDGEDASWIHLHTTKDESGEYAYYEHGNGERIPMWAGQDNMYREPQDALDEAEETGKEARMSIKEQIFCLMFPEETKYFG